MSSHAVCGLLCMVHFFLFLILCRNSC
jgi:hypothetical protein